MSAVTSTTGPPEDDLVREVSFHLRAAQSAAATMHQKGFDVGGHHNEWMGWTSELKDALDSAGVFLRLIEVLGK